MCASQGNDNTRSCKFEKEELTNCILGGQKLDKKLVDVEKKALRGTPMTEGELIKFHELVQEITELVKQARKKSSAIKGWMAM